MNRSREFILICLIALFVGSLGISYIFVSDQIKNREEAKWAQFEKDKAYNEALQNIPKFPNEKIQTNQKMDWKMITEVLNSPALPEIMSDQSNLSSLLQSGEQVLTDPELKKELRKLKIEDSQSLLIILKCHEGMSVREAMAQIFSWKMDDPEIEKKVRATTWNEILVKIIEGLKKETLAKTSLPYFFLEVTAQNNPVFEAILKKFGKDKGFIKLLCETKSLKEDANIGQLLQAYHLSPDDCIEDIVKNFVVSP
jgi:hypothetical protein